MRGLYTLSIIAIIDCMLITACAVHVPQSDKPVAIKTCGTILRRFTQDDQTNFENWLKKHPKHDDSFSLLILDTARMREDIRDCENSQR